MFLADIGRKCCRRKEIGNKWLTSMELNCFPLYASTNSATLVVSRNFITTMDLFGAESLEDDLG